MFVLGLASSHKKSQFSVINTLYNLSFVRKILTVYQAFPHCWGWAITQKRNGGSIATIGNTGIGMAKEDKVSLRGGTGFLNNQFFYVYNLDNSKSLGDLWKDSISKYLDSFPINWSTHYMSDDAKDVKTVQQWVLFGDPSLKIGGYENAYNIIFNS